MNDITEKVIKSIKENFEINGLYSLSKNLSQTVFCIHVNGLVNLGMAELGYKNLATANLKKILNSPLFSKENNLFYREIDNKTNIVNNQFNVCKNAIVALSLIAANESKKAEMVIEALYQSPLFDKKTNLFFREYDPITKKVNRLIITQTNLWLAITLLKLGQTDQAQKIITEIENIAIDPKTKLFISEDCREDEKKKQFIKQFFPMIRL